MYKKHLAIKIGCRPLLLLLVATLFPIFIASLNAMPPHPEVQEKLDRDEIPQPFYKDYYYGIPPAYKINAPEANNSAAITGPFKILCILVDFSDKVAQIDPREFDTLIFENQFGTVRHYYDEVSYGQLDIVAVDFPSAIGWQRAPQTLAWYANNDYGTGSYPQNTQKLCEDLVDMVAPLVDFSEYDNDGNGWVDVVMIAHAGRGAEYSGSTGDIWSHKWGISPRLIDGVYISSYTIMPEYWNSPGDMTIGVYCHELGHAFGLPDLYDTEDTSQGGTVSQGIGRWSLMAGGSWNGINGSSPAHLDAWCRQEVGWLNPINITSNQTNVSIPNVETNEVAFRLWTNGSQGNEYFLVTNRQRLGYDASLPYHGLLIWHIDENVLTDNDKEWYPGYTSNGHYLVALEQADGLWEMEQNSSSGNGGDPYPGSTSNFLFTPTSTPNSDSYSASGTYVSITNISASSSTMTADFAVSLAADADNGSNDALPQWALKQNYPNPFNPATVIEYSLKTSGEVKINVFNVLGQPVKTLVSKHHDPGEYQIMWNATDNDNKAVSSGVYFYELTSQDARLVKKMVLTR